MHWRLNALLQDDVSAARHLLRALSRLLRRLLLLDKLLLPVGMHDVELLSYLLLRARLAVLHHVHLTGLTVWSSNLSVLRVRDLYWSVDHLLIDILLRRLLPVLSLLRSVGHGLHHSLWLADGSDLWAMLHLHKSYLLLRHEDAELTSLRRYTLSNRGLLRLRDCGDYCLRGQRLHRTDRGHLRRRNGDFGGLAAWV